MQIKGIPKNEPYFLAAVCICFVGNKSDVLLLQKRQDDPLYPGLWDFPAGKKKPCDRTLLQTACREIKEETGNVIPFDRLQACHTNAYLHHKPDGKAFYFIARTFCLQDFTLPTFRRNMAEHKAALIVPAADLIGMNPKSFIPDAHSAFVNLHKQLKQTGKL